MAVTESTYNQIMLSGDYVSVELPALGTITPGMLIEAADSTPSGTDSCKAHSTATGRAEAMFAAEDALQGNGVTDNYLVGNKVFAKVCKPGALVYARLDLSESVVPGAILVSAGNGNLQEAATPLDEDIVAYATEIAIADGSNVARTVVRIK